MGIAILVPAQKAQTVRQLLEQYGLLDKKRKLQKFASKNEVAIPIITSDLGILAHIAGEEEEKILLVETDLPLSKREMILSPAESLKKAVAHLLIQNNVQESDIEKLLLEVPHHWEKHGDLILLPGCAFQSSFWSCFGASLWQTVQLSLKTSRVARQATVSADCFRSPQVELLHGDNGIVLHKDNGIRYLYDITKCMFSAGNITEKLRIADFDCTRETVVDMYAGIGYFTLPYLVHASAAHVHACEWNPHALAFLLKNLQLNGVQEKCTIHAGDNRQLQLQGVADRVNLGLIPSSEDGWPMACRVLKPTGGVMHIHGNVNSLTGVCERLQIGKAAEHSYDVSFHAVDRKEIAPEMQQYKQHKNNILCTKQMASESEDCSSDLNVMLSSKPAVMCSCLQHENLLQGDFGGNVYRQLGNCTCPATVCVQSELSSCCTTFDGRDHGDNVKSMQHSHHKASSWSRWGESVCKALQVLLQKEHGSTWHVCVSHIQHVKSYAPHVDHIVLDVQCSLQA